ncbi:oxidoreductase, partial [Campylobacter jejuni]
MNNLSSVLILAKEEYINDLK